MRSPQTPRSMTRLTEDISNETSCRCTELCPVPRVDTLLCSDQSLPRDIQLLGVEARCTSPQHSQETALAAPSCLSRFGEAVDMLETCEIICLAPWSAPST